MPLMLGLDREMSLQHGHVWDVQCSGTVNAWKKAFTATPQTDARRRRTTFQRVGVPSPISVRKLDACDVTWEPDGVNGLGSNHRRQTLLGKQGMERQVGALGGKRLSDFGEEPHLRSRLLAPGRELALTEERVPHVELNPL